ncbi:hypothetical protein GBAR_LOCUS1806, partial [Geodia barretti]
MCTSFLCSSSCNPLTCIVSPSPTSTYVSPSLNLSLSRDPLHLLFLRWSLLAALRIAVSILVQVGSNVRSCPEMEVFSPAVYPLHKQSHS